MKPGMSTGSEHPHHSPKTPVFFFKPDQETPDNRNLFEADITQPPGKIYFRTLNLDNDLDTIWNWAGQPYSKKFWQSEGSRPALCRMYQNMLADPNTHSFIGFFNNQRVCQIDTYNPLFDELREHMEFREGDCGLHLLMLPPRQLLRGLSQEILRQFICYYFSHKQAERLFAEPDKENELANRLAVKTGFRYLKTIDLSYKTANLYSITRNQFYETYHQS